MAVSGSGRGRRRAGTERGSVVTQMERSRIASGGRVGRAQPHKELGDGLDLS